MANQKKWTVMVWMAGDNDLEANGVEDIQEMKQVGSNDDLNIVVQFDRMSDHNMLRYLLRKGTPLESDVVSNPRYVGMTMTSLGVSGRDEV